MIPARPLRSEERTALYRHFDAGGVLLYVGISTDVLRRLLQHRERSGWIEHVSRVELEWFASRREAVSAEAVAIQRELPPWNVLRPSCASVFAGNFAIEHVTSGRRDGNYFDRRVAQEVLDCFRADFPADEFRLVSAPPDAPPGGASNFRKPLRGSEAAEWSVLR